VTVRTFKGHLVSTNVSESPFPAERWMAVYDQTYDGAPDSGNRGHIGFGATEQEAINDLLENYDA
jgi:hypothetical protein